MQSNFQRKRGSGLLEVYSRTYINLAGLNTGMLMNFMSPNRRGRSPVSFFDCFVLFVSFVVVLTRLSYAHDWHLPLDGTGGAGSTSAVVGGGEGNTGNASGTRAQ